MNFKQNLTDIISKQLNQSITLEIPPAIELGNLALHCYKLKIPPDQMQKKLILPKYIEKTEIKGPYLNFFINKSYFTKSVIESILKLKDKYGSNNLGKNKKALVEHTSINPNASPHVGRARNAIIGDFIVRLLKFENYKVETHYYVNDIGKQIAMLVLACNKKKPSFNSLLQLYIDFNKKLENNQELEKEVFNLLNKLESGNKNIIKQFHDVVNICIKGQSKILSDLDIKYNFFDFESKFLFDGSTNRILKQLENKGRLFKDKDGRTAINLEGFNLPMENPYLPLTRADGTSLYLIRDIAYTIFKDNKAKDKNIVVLGEDQKLYYLQLKAILSLLNYKAPEVVHYSFILLSSGKMSTRRGEVVLLEDFMKEAFFKAQEEIIKRHGKIKNINRLSKQIAYGAVKFAILKVSPDRNIIFDLEKALSFEGDSAPYIQYAYARANSILKKVKSKKLKLDFNLLNSKEELLLLSKLAEFPEIINTSIKNLQPHILTFYCLDIAKLFNEFYHSCSVLSSKNSIKQIRLKLVESTQIILKTSLNLLGIDAPENM